MLNDHRIRKSLGLDILQYTVFVEIVRLSLKKSKFSINTDIKNDIANTLDLETDIVDKIIDELLLKELLGPEKIRLKHNPIVDGEEQYGNVKVTQILEFLKKSFGIADFREPIKMQRNIASHIILAIDKIGKDAFKQTLHSIVNNKWKREQSNSIIFLYREIKSAKISDVLIEPNKNYTII